MGGWGWWWGAEAGDSLWGSRAVHPGQWRAAARTGPWPRSPSCAAVGRSLGHSGLWTELTLVALIPEAGGPAPCLGRAGSAGCSPPDPSEPVPHLPSRPQHALPLQLPGFQVHGAVHEGACGGPRPSGTALLPPQCRLPRAGLASVALVAEPGTGVGGWSPWWCHGHAGPCPSSGSALRASAALCCPQLVGMRYLHEVLKPVVSRVFEEKKYVELDPCKMDLGRAR